MRSVLKRIGLLAAYALGLAACGGDGGGPTGPSVPKVAGVYSGVSTTTFNGCGGEIGSRVGSTVVQQNGTSISIQLEQITITGTLQASGNFTASGIAVIQGVTQEISMNGSFTGDRLLASETVNLSVQEQSCQILRTFNLTRE